MEEIGIKIFEIGMGCLIAAMLASIKSLQACSEKRLEWMFLFGAFRETLADKPNIKRPYEEYKISNRAKIIYHYVECILWFIVNASIWVSAIIAIIGLVMSKF